MTATSNSGSDSGNRFREGVTAILALGIAGVTLFMVIETFLGAGDQNFNSRKDVLLYGLSMLGAVIGYYFGRVPAELHAKASADKADQAQQQAESERLQRQSLAKEYKATLLSIKDNLLQPNTPPSSNFLAQAQATGLTQALAEVDAALVKW